MDINEIKVGTELYLHKHTGYYYIDLCKNPYTVIGIKGNKVIIQEAECIFYGDRYYDTLPDEIVPCSYGNVKTLRKDKNGYWVVTPIDINKEYAVFGKYEYMPYLD